MCPDGQALGKEQADEGPDGADRQQQQADTPVGNEGEGDDHGGIYQGEPLPHARLAAGDGKGSFLVDGGCDGVEARGMGHGRPPLDGISREEGSTPA